MGDSRRFDVFADFIAHHVPNKSVRIADVAAGKGYLSLALRERGFRNVISFEPYPRGKMVRRLQLQARLFEGGEFDVIVGMHPDQATDVILDEAAKRKAMAFVVPCCAFGNRWTFWNMSHQVPKGIPVHRSNTSYTRWLEHLIRESSKRGLQLNKTVFPISGRNIVLYGR